MEGAPVYELSSPKLPENINLSSQSQWVFHSSLGTARFKESSQKPDSSKKQQGQSHKNMD